MNIGQFKQYIEDNNLPDDMPMGILDLSTDDVDDANYAISKETLLVEDCVNLDDPCEVIGKMLFFTIDNKLNPDPIPDYNTENDG